MTRDMLNAFKDMPIVLKFITAHALICSCFALVAIVPGIPVEINGVRMESQGIWEKDWGIPLVATGLALPIIGLLFLNRWKYSRQIYAVALFGVFFLLNMTSLIQKPAYLLFPLIVVGVLTSYLFLNKKVRDYFNM
ncbi:hypothetical protein [Thalassotalea litorea]|uniref:hypothetical protein n=1 Tax=Thalassotalea litorea TaxID=2020715 RepID=UPI003735493D